MLNVPPYLHEISFKIAVTLRICRSHTSPVLIALGGLEKRVVFSSCSHFSVRSWLIDERAPTKFRAWMLFREIPHTLLKSTTYSNNAIFVDWTKVRTWTLFTYLLAFCQSVCFCRRVYTLHIICHIYQFDCENFLLWYGEFVILVFTVLEECMLWLGSVHSSFWNFIVCDSGCPEDW